jgi:hypothetical protein
MRVASFPQLSQSRSARLPERGVELGSFPGEIHVVKEGLDCHFPSIACIGGVRAITEPRLDVRSPIQDTLYLLSEY